MKNTKNIVYLGSRNIGFNCLKYILENEKNLNVKVIAVATQLREGYADGYDIADLTKLHEIPLIDTPDKIPDCHIIYSVEYHKIITQKHINKASDIAVNLHLGPLPDYRGCNQFSFAIFDRAEFFGVTIHEIDSGIDSGDILFEDRFKIPEKIWVEELYVLGVNKGQALFENTIEKIINGEYIKKPQNIFKDRPKKINYRKEIEILKYIDMNEDADTIARKIRSTYMPGFDPPYVVIDGRKMLFKEYEG